jgi:phosphoglycolate phosphatase
MAKYDAVLFDFDGTMIDSSRGIFQSLIYALKCGGVDEPDEATLRKFIGPPIYDSFKNLFHFSEDKIEFEIQKYREHYSAGGLYEYDVYDGIPELLKVLHDNGIKTATASSKPRKFIEIILEHSGLGKYIDYIGGTSFDEKGAGKAAILLDAMENLGCTDKSRVLMVGDRKYDIDGAKGAGIETAAVLYGFGSREEFEEHGAEYIVETTKEIENIVFGE